ncbi:MAG: hypothetical protein IPL72_18205 [Sulfuritalea sp.]|jgi:hypothetical protein|nr:hypothetical protein [Sulfuritalea sp.]
MAAPCGGDPLVCIEFVILGIGEFLKDWTTMGMLAILLGLLLRYRADRAKAREDAYGRHLADFDTRRSQAAQGGAGSPAELFPVASTRRGADHGRRR